MEQAVQRFIRALVKRAGEGDGQAVTALRDLTTYIRGAESEGVQVLMDSPTAASWAMVAVLTGTTRQGAMARYQGCTPSRTAGGQPGHLR